MRSRPLRWLMLLAGLAWTLAACRVGGEVGMACEEREDCVGHLVCRDGSCHICDDTSECPDDRPLCVPDQGCFECTPETALQGLTYRPYDEDQPNTSCPRGQICRLGWCVYAGEERP